MKLVVFFLIILFFGDAKANFFDLYGVGPVGMSTASAQTASAEGYRAIWYNPANLSLVKKTVLSFNYTKSLTFLDLAGASIKDCGSAAGLIKSDSLDCNAIRDTENFAASQLAIVIPLRGYFKNRGAFGATVLLPQNDVVRVEGISADIAQWYEYQSKPDQIMVSLGLGFRPHEYIALGIGLRTLSRLAGKISVLGNLATQKIESENISVNLELRNSFNGSLTLFPTDSLRFAFSFREGLGLELDLPSRILLKDLEVEGLLVAQETALYTPPHLNFGISYYLKEETKLNFDLSYIMYSQDPPPTVKIFFTVQGDDLDRIGLEDSFTLPRDCRETKKDDGYYDVKCNSSVKGLAAKDVLVPRFSFEHDPERGMKYRAGYSYRPRALPLQSGYSNYVDTTSHKIGLGLGYGIQDPFGTARQTINFDLGSVLIIHPEANTYKDALNPSPSTGNYSASGFVYAISFGVDVDL